MMTNMLMIEGGNGSPLVFTAIAIPFGKSSMDVVNTMRSASGTVNESLSMRADRFLAQVIPVHVVSRESWGSSPVFPFPWASAGQ